MGLFNARRGSRRVRGEDRHLRNQGRSPEGEGSMNKQTITDIDIAGKRVLIRADLNVPLDKGMVSDDTRIVAALPTIRYVLAYGATPIVCSHLGRPKGKPDAKYSLKPVAERLTQLLGCRVQMAPDCIGPEAERMAAANIPRG